MRHDFIQYRTMRREDASNTSAVHLKQWVAAHSSKLWSGIIKPTLSVSSKTREKHIWQKRRENGGRVDRENEEDGGRWKRRGQRKRGNGGNNEHIFDASKVQWWNISNWNSDLTLRGRLKPQSASALLFFSPCEEFPDFQNEYSAGALQRQPNASHRSYFPVCWYISTKHICMHIGTLNNSVYLLRLGKTSIQFSFSLHYTI